MNTLIEVRTNISYAKKDKKKKEDADEYTKHFELIFLVDKPKYSQINSGEIIRERGIEELRFIVSENALKTLLNHLDKMKDVDEFDIL